MRARILLVEDDDTLGMSLEMSLAGLGHEVVWARKLAPARVAAEKERPDLVILDLGLPDGDGLQLCRELREAGNRAPILVLTARGTIEARVEGLDAGADDYVTKPFELPELLARIEALLRRQRWTETPVTLSRVGRLEVDFEARMVKDQSGPVEMTDLEFRLLRYLVLHRGRTVTREELLTRVWERPSNARTRSVDVFVSRLRRRIEGEDGTGQSLVPVRGVGYRLEEAAVTISGSLPEDPTNPAPPSDA